MLVFLFFLLSVGYSVGLTPALSYTEYRRVIDDETGFYSSVMDANPLFYLPYTYYVKVLGEAGEFTHVEIHGEGGRAALDGYVYADQQAEVDALTAANAGVDCILVDWGFRDRDVLEKAQAKAVVSTPPQLLECLMKD